jgi:hypothetical protein
MLRATVLGEPLPPGIHERRARCIIPERAGSEKTSLNEAFSRLVPDEKS